MIKGNLSSCASLVFNLNVALTEPLEPFELCRSLDTFISYSCTFALSGFSCRVAELVLMKKAFANSGGVAFYPRPLSRGVANVCVSSIS
ncbi:unnamed protein product [Heligmosomoides polygyrus]|uniref:Secreted protein n=1 Tax=Heligmosomoides polygyrus TaxID=6339 RepID=A0A183GLI4_HELPZ|nr:unnamed protein product [Heligmosomoides polygyrus]